jgi:3-phosphoshikimate 1-carboxyvinyltransferase
MGVRSEAENAPTPWLAPRAHEPVGGRIALPGSKSITNRALVLAALADDDSLIRGPLRARDTHLMVEALRALGIAIDDEADGWRVTPGPMNEAVVATGLAGTVMRFVPALAGLAHGPVTFDGDERARERPMWALIDGLRQAGVVVEDAGRERLPFTVRGIGTVAGGLVQVDASASSQFISGLLLAGARYDKGLELLHTGRDPVPSQPHLTMTVDMLRDAGVDVSQPSATSWHVVPGPVRARTLTVEPDLSNAAPFLAAAVVTGGAVTVPGWPQPTTQPGDALPDLLARMGARVERDADAITVAGTGSIGGVDVDLRDVTELATVIAAVAAVADGPSRLRGLTHTRGHETDRIVALATELGRLGGSVTELDDGLAITPRPLHGAIWHTYGDHRMATAGAVLGLVVDGVRIDDIAATSKTLPDFPALWSGLIGG